MRGIKDFVRAMVKSEVFVSRLTLLYKYSFSVNARHRIVPLFLGLFPKCNLSVLRRINYNQIKTSLEYGFILCLR